MGFPDRAGCSGPVLAALCALLCLPIPKVILVLYMHELDLESGALLCLPIPKVLLALHMHEFRLHLSSFHVQQVVCSPVSAAAHQSAQLHPAIAAARPVQQTLVGKQTLAVDCIMHHASCWEVTPAVMRPERVLIMVWCREYDKAWKHLAEANQLQRSLVSYDPQHDAMLSQVQDVSNWHPVALLCTWPFVFPPSCRLMLPAEC